MQIAPDHLCGIREKGLYLEEGSSRSWDLWKGWALTNVPATDTNFKTLQGSPSDLGAKE